VSYKVYVTKLCPNCGSQGSLTIWEDDMNRYLNGANAQDAFPDLLPPMREQIMSGIHPQCWNKIFKDDDGQK
jgi:hypothetical protein